MKIKEAEKFLDKGFMKNNNYKVINVSSEYCELEGTITETSLNPFGIVHGGYIFGLIDSAAGILINKQDTKFVTISTNIEYIGNTSTGKITALAKILKKGKNVSYAEVEVYDEKKKLIAKALTNFFNITK